MALSRVRQEDEERCPPGCNAITQGEGEAEEEERRLSPALPVLATIAFFGFMIFAIAKRPFG